MWFGFGGRLQLESGALNDLWIAVCGRRKNIPHSEAKLAASISKMNCFYNDDSHSL